MKTPIRILLFVASLWFAGSSFAQTVTTGSASPSPTPPPVAGTYKDTTLTIAQRIQAASDVLESAMETGDERGAALFMLNTRPVLPLLQKYPDFADKILADPNLDGVIGGSNNPVPSWPDQSSLKRSAIFWKGDTMTNVDDKIAWLRTSGTSYGLTPGDLASIQLAMNRAIMGKAQSQYDAGNYQSAIDSAIPVVPYYSRFWVDPIGFIVQCKVCLRSPDVLSWAKLAYLRYDFGHTQAGIDCVSSAYRALDTGVSRANVFLQYVKDGKGQNPLAVVPYPQVQFDGDFQEVKILNLQIAGNNAEAIKQAARQFSLAKAGQPLTYWTAFLAQTLRNTDGNIVRANAFVQAQSAGQTYPIAELNN